jgi:hypothetical protein
MFDRGLGLAHKGLKETLNGKHPMFAHITKTKTGYDLRITDSNRPVGGVVFNVAGKREARVIAAQHNARAWNF